jgi:hypothetical protein
MTEPESPDLFLIINIGRNVLYRPMNNTKWFNFQRDVKLTISNYGQLVGSGHGTSRWDDSSEEFAVLHALVAPDWLPSLRQALARLARQYSQYAIACVISTPDSLVTP